MRVIVGDEVGLVKRIDFTAAGTVSKPAPDAKADKADKGDKKTLFSVSSILSTISRDAAVELLRMSSNNSRVIVATKDGRVSVVAVESGVVESVLQVFTPATEKKKPTNTSGNKAREEEHFIGIYEAFGTIITCTNKGDIAYHPQLSFLSSKDESTKLPTLTVSISQDALTTMKVFPQNPRYLATAGIEREVNLWKATDDGKLESVWKAKNVPNNYLDLRVPVHVTDLQFARVSIESSVESNAADSVEVKPAKIAVSTLYKHFRVYDITGGKRQPIVSVEVGDMPLKRVSLSPDGSHAVVTDTTGSAIQVSVETGARVGAYRGFSGAVTDLTCVDAVNLDESTGLLLTVGIDRFLRIFERDGKRRLLHKIYLKHRLHSLTIDESYVPEAAPMDEKSKKKARFARYHKDIPVDEEEDDQFWARMQAATASDDEEAGNEAGDDENDGEEDEIIVEVPPSLRKAKGKSLSPIGNSKKAAAPAEKKRKRA